LLPATLFGFGANGFDQRMRLQEFREARRNAPVPWS